jgi:uncharacterized protein (DUF983 family)
MPELSKTESLPLKLTLTGDLSGDEAQAHTQLRDLKPGDRCPACGQAHLDYDGLLNLACPACGYALGGCFT